MICAITGHTGILGSNFIKYNQNIKFIKFKGDLAKSREVYEWVVNTKFDCLLHFGAIVPIKQVEKNKDYAKKVNFKSVDIITKGLKKKNKKLWFFFPSSSHVYNYSNKKIKETNKTNPLNYYGSLKLAAEKVIQKKLSNTKINFCIGRIFSFTHHNQKKSFFIPRLYSNKASLKSTYRDFIHVKDICSCINILMKNNKKGIYNIASGKKINLLKINSIMHNKKIYIRKKTKENLFADISKVKSTGWKPTYSIEDIIRDYKNNI